MIYLKGKYILQIMCKSDPDIFINC